MATAPLVFAADEDPVALRALEALLKEETDCEVLSFRALDAMVARADERPPDAVILEWGLAARARPLWEALLAGDPHLALFFVTRAEEGDAATTALRARGPLAHLQKPFDPGDVIAKLSAALERRRLAQGLE